MGFRRGRGRRLSSVLWACVLPRVRVFVCSLDVRAGGCAASWGVCVVGSAWRGGRRVLLFRLLLNYGGACFSRFFFVYLYCKKMIINPLALFYYVFLFIFFKCYSLRPCCACFGSCVFWLRPCSLSVWLVCFSCLYRHVFLSAGLCAPFVFVPLPPLSVLCL